MRSIILLESVQGYIIVQNSKNLTKLQVNEQVEALSVLFEKDLAVSDETGRHMTITTERLSPNDLSNFIGLSFQFVTSHNVLSTPKVKAQNSLVF